MKTNKLGRTGLNVTEICLGTMTWGRQNSEAEGHAQIDYARDAGINFMDTAEMYAVPTTKETSGKTEEIIGSWFKANGQRDKWIVASKIAGDGIAWIRDGAPMSAAAVQIAIDGSLKRLCTDYIDLYQLHWPNRGHYHFDKSWAYDPSTQDTNAVKDNIAEVLEAAGELVKTGKVRHIGLSNETVWGTMQHLALAEAKGLPRIASMQNEYSLIKRQADLDLAEMFHHEDIGLLAYSPLGAGVISGKYLGGAMPEGTRGAVAGAMYRQNEYSDPAIRAYIDLARTHNLDVSQMAIAFALTRPFMTSVIIGATTMDQLKTNIAASDLTLSPEVMAGIEAIHRLYPRTI